MKKSKLSATASKRKALSWKMEKMCDNCPFAEAGPGLQLWESLTPARRMEIKRGLLGGEHFFCHKTASDEGFDEEYENYSPLGRERVCAGSLEFQKKNGVSSIYQRICERLDSIVKVRK